MNNPAVFGGLVKVPPNTPDDNVLLRDGSFEPRAGLKRSDPRLQLYGGGLGVMMATGQIVPLTAVPE